MNQTLAGLRVIDFSQVAAGPTCTMMLADRGADVVKIEAPSGDLGRQLVPPQQGGHGVIFLTLNRNKRSMVLDLKDPQGLETARQLIAGADIVVESFRPGVMQRLGLGYDVARALRPDVIYCSISAYGQRSSDRDRPGVDGILQAVSGLMSVTGVADGEPCKVQAPIVDMTTGILATLAIQDALLHHAATGQGQWLDVSMYAATMQLQQTAMASYFSCGEVPEGNGSGAPYSAPNEAYRTQDGWVMVAAYHPKRWQAFCQLLELDGIEHDPRFATSAHRVANRPALTRAIAPAMLRRTTAQWLRLLEAEDIICAPVANYRDVADSAAFRSGGFTATYLHPEAGQVDMIGPFHAAMDGSPPAPRPAPLLGQHTQDILAELRQGSINSTDDSTA